MLRQVRLAAATELCGEAAALRVPTLIAWGRRDLTMPVSSGVRLAACIPGAELALGPGRHDRLITAPAAFAALVERFAARIAPAP